MTVSHPGRYDRQNAPMTDQHMPPRSGSLLPLLCCLVLGGCALPALDERIDSTVLPEQALRGAWLDAATVPLTRLHPDESGILPLTDPRQAFAARMVLASTAERTLDVQYYIWHMDITGTLMLEALHDAADRGVRVRLLLDDNGIRDMDEVLAALDRHPNMEVRLFNPFSIRKPKTLGFITHFSRANRRMHNKSFTADQRATIIGGRNIGDEYFAASDGLLFSDLDVLAMGPVVNDTALDFDRYWASGSSYPVSLILPSVSEERLAALTDAAHQVARDPRAEQYLQALQTQAQEDRIAFNELRFEWAPTRLISDDPAKGLGKADDSDLLISALPALIGEATDSFDLVSPYFVPTAKGVEALAAMSARGVRVRILTNSLEATDVAAVHAGYAKRRRALLKAGITLLETQRQPGDPGRNESAGPFGSSGSSLHAKTFAVDGRKVFIGSFNFDPRSARLNTELGFVIDSPALASAIDDAFEQRIPQEAYRVQLDARGRLYWTEQRGDEEIIHAREPGASLLKRLGVKVLSWLPIEWLL